MKKRKKQKKRWNKKAEFFMSVLAVVAIISYVSLFAVVTDKNRTFVSKIGNKQFAIEGSELAAEKALFYIDISAPYALQQASKDLAASGGILASTSEKSEVWECGTHRGSPLLFAKNKICKKSSDQFLSALNTYFNERFDEYLKKYYDRKFPEISIPLHNYILQFKGDKVYGFAQNDLIVPIYVKTDSDHLIELKEQYFGYGNDCEPIEQQQYQLEDLKRIYGATKEEVEGQQTQISFMNKKIRVHEKTKNAFACVEAEIKECDAALAYDLKEVRVPFVGDEEGALSQESFGIAIDINPNENPTCMADDPAGKCSSPGQIITDVPSCVVVAFKRYGFSWGAQENSKAPMHFVFKGDPGETIENQPRGYLQNSGELCALPETFSLPSPLSACNKYKTLLEEYRKKNGLDKRGVDLLLLTSIVLSESSCNHNQKNNQGLMQVVACGKQGGCSLKENVNRGTTILAQKIDSINRKGVEGKAALIFYLFGYNRGEGTTEKAIELYKKGMPIEQAMYEACFEVFKPKIKRSIGACGGFDVKACCGKPGTKTDLNTKRVTNHDGSGLGAMYPKSILDKRYYPACQKVLTGT